MTIMMNGDVDDGDSMAPRIPPGWDKGNRKGEAVGDAPRAVTMMPMLVMMMMTTMMMVVLPPRRMPRPLRPWSGHDGSELHEIEDTIG